VIVVALTEPKYIIFEDAVELKPLPDIVTEAPAFAVYGEN